MLEANAEVVIETNVSTDEIQVLQPEEPVTPAPSQTELADPVANPPLFQDLPRAQNVFFDSQSIVPESQQANRGPRFVDPTVEPGTRLVLVEKDHQAGSYKSSLVSAQRAISLGRHESALEILNNLYSRDNTDQAVLMAMAVAYQRSDQNDLAVQTYQDLLDIDPDNVDARVNMLGILAQKYPSVAFRQLSELKMDNPNNIGIVSQLAVVTANLGEFEDAIRYLGVAASMDPRNASHLFNMAVIADRAGERGQALSYYEQALELDTLYGKGESIPRAQVFERLADLRQ